MSAIEIVATLLGLINVTLVVQRSVWNYPFGIAMVSLYAQIFYEAKLYSDALLQLFFLLLNAYGWWNWQRSREAAGEVVVLALGMRGRAAWLVGTIVATAGWGWLMHSQTDAHYPWWDGAVAVGSVAAQILQSRRRWECWLFWIAVDLLAIPLYAVKGLWLTAGLYTIFLALAVWGLIDWLRALRGRSMA